MKKVSVRYGTSRGTKMTVKGTLELDVGTPLAQQGDATFLMVGDAGPFLSAQAAGALFTANRRGTSYTE